MQSRALSTEQGLDQEFNSLDAQYDAASAYIKSQAHAGWALIRSRYDDGGYSGGSTDRPDLQRLLDDNDEYPKKGIVFALGNQAKRPQTWQLLGVIRLDELVQGELFG